MVFGEQSSADGLSSEPWGGSSGSPGPSCGLWGQREGSWAPEGTWMWQNPVHPSSSPGDAATGMELPHAGKMEGPTTTTLALLKAELGTCPQGAGVTGKHRHRRTLCTVYLSQNEQRCGKMLGKSPNRTVPNSKHKPDRDLVCRHRLRRAARRKTQLEEAPFSRSVSPKAAVRGVPSFPCSAGLGLGALRPRALEPAPPQRVDPPPAIK